MLAVAMSLASQRTSLRAPLRLQIIISATVSGCEDEKAENGGEKISHNHSIGMTINGRNLRLSSESNQLAVSIADKAKTFSSQKLTSNRNFFRLHDLPHQGFASLSPPH